VIVVVKEADHRDSPYEKETVGAEALTLADGLTTMNLGEEVPLKLIQGHCYCYLTALDPFPVNNQALTISQNYAIVLCYLISFHLLLFFNHTKTRLKY